MEPDAVIAAALEDAVRTLAQVDRHRRFETARVQLGATSYDLIVTNMRLEAFNGLHLVYLAASPLVPARSVVYTEQLEPAPAREVQRAGALYDTAVRLAVTLGSYLNSNLPSHDRRDPTIPDRRTAFRGGRRSWDEHILRNPT